MQCGAYRFHCKFTTEALLPEFKGSMLRGAFGHALKNVVCALRRHQCDNCLLTATCVYHFIFEVSKTMPDTGPDRPRVAARPHPFVLISPDSIQRSYGIGSTFDFGLILFGKANDYLPHLVYAVEQMGDGGLGKGAKQGQGRFELVAVRSQDTIAYDGASKILQQVLPPPCLELAGPPSEAIGAIKVKLLSPLRLKHHNQFQDSLPFHLLIRAALRRISTLAEAYGSGEPPLDYSGLIKRAGQVQTMQSACGWVDLKRFSNRQNSTMLMGGVQGNATYEGDLAEFLPLLRYCEQTHLGKQTAFGLGRIEVECSGAQEVQKV
jgi:CRISPR/Cas system endoribonuclease Cas6 (RAMP superfamily)